jgi:hypothetical protein
MASVTPGYSFTGSTDPITYTKLNLLAQPTVALGAGEVGTAELASNISISGLTITAGTPLFGSATTETFSSTITLTDGNSKGNTRLIACTSSTASTITATGIPQAGTQLIVAFTTDGTAGNVITFSTGFKATGTYTLASANKYYTILFVSDGTYYREVCRSGAAG